MNILKKRVKYDVAYSFPPYKRCIAYSTLATFNYLQMLSDKYGTIEEMKKHVVYDYKAEEVLNIFIEKGHKDKIFNDYFW